MNVELMFDHQAIVEERRPSAFFAVTFTAPEVLRRRARPAAYCLALDLAPGVDSAAFCETLAAAHLFIRHLRRDDQLAIVTYASDAEVLYPLGEPVDKPSLHALIDNLFPAHGSNLRAAKRLGARELRRAARRKPVFVPLQDAVGCNAEEFVASHLGQLQPLAVSDIRLRLDLLDFCEWAEPLGRHRDNCFPIANSRYEYAIDDLLAGEERHACFQLHIPPLPQLDGDDNLTLIGEPILNLEVAYQSHLNTPPTPMAIQRTLTAQKLESLSKS